MVRLSVEELFCKVAAEYLPQNVLAALLRRMHEQPGVSTHDLRNLEQALLATAQLAEQAGPATINLL